MQHININIIGLVHFKGRMTVNRTVDSNAL